MVSVSTLRLILIGLIAGGAIGVLFAIIEGSFTPSSSESRSHTSNGLQPTRRQTLRSANRINTVTPAVLLQPQQQAQAIPTEQEGAHEASMTTTVQEAGVRRAVNAADAGVSQASSSLLAVDKDLRLDAVEPQLKRVCGSPAVDGYAHVKPECLQNSPTNKLWWLTHKQGDRSGEGLACNIEASVSLDGLAVGWGIGNKKDTPEECCQACRDHIPGPHIPGPFGMLPCNAWVYCTADECFEADAHKHSRGDCWLKFTEAPQSPEVNARGAFSQEFRRRHPEAPDSCQWVSGVLVPPGQVLTNGTWGPRASW